MKEEDEAIDIIDDGQSDSRASQRIPKCARCRCHGINNELKGHKEKCQFKDCECRLCLMVVERQKITAMRVAHLRHQRKVDKQRVNKFYSPYSSLTEEEDYVLSNYMEDEHARRHRAYIHEKYRHLNGRSCSAPLYKHAGYEPRHEHAYRQYIESYSPRLLAYHLRAQVPHPCTYSCCRGRKDLKMHADYHPARDYYQYPRHHDRHMHYERVEDTKLSPHDGKDIEMKNDDRNHINSINNSSYKDRKYSHNNYSDQSNISRSNSNNSFDESSERSMSNKGHNEHNSENSYCNRNKSYDDRSISNINCKDRIIDYERSNSYLDRNDRKIGYIERSDISSGSNGEIGNTPNPSYDGRNSSHSYDDTPADRSNNKPNDPSNAINGCNERRISSIPGLKEHNNSNKEVNSNNHKSEECHHVVNEAQRRDEFIKGKCWEVLTVMFPDFDIALIKYASEKARYSIQLAMEYLLDMKKKLREGDHRPTYTHYKPGGPPREPCPCCNNKPAGKPIVKVEESSDVEEKRRAYESMYGTIEC